MYRAEVRTSAETLIIFQNEAQAASDADDMEWHEVNDQLISRLELLGNAVCKHEKESQEYESKLMLAKSEFNTEHRPTNAAQSELDAYTEGSLRLNPAGFHRIQQQDRDHIKTPRTFPLT